MKLFICFLFIFSIHAYSEEDAFVDDLNELTDQQQFESEQIHQGITQRVFKDSCENAEIKDLCQNKNDGFNDDGTVMGKASKIIEKMAPMIPPTMSAILGSSKIPMKTGNKFVNGEKFIKQDNGKFKRAKDGADGLKTEAELKGELKEGNEIKDETENATDVCVHIPTVLETGVQAYKLLNNENIEAQFNATEQASRQKASIESIKKAQEGLITASYIQASGWGATAACYTGYMIYGGVADPKTIAKAAGATLLGTFFLFKASAHKERVDALKGILAKFPKAGECNPHTETTCFCNEETSAAADPNNFRLRCVPPPFQDRVGQSPFACVDAQGKSDPQCLCKQNNNCIGQRLKTGLANVGLAPNTISPILQGLTPLNSGTAGGDLEGLAKKNLALAKKNLAKIKPTKIPNFKLSPKQKALAKQLASFGVPKVAAATIASTPSSNAALNAAARATSADGEFKNEDLKKAYRNSGVRFSRKSNPFGRKRSKRKRSAFNPFGFGKKKKSARSGGSDVEILDDFQRKAAARAEINRDKGKSIFDIITYRYTSSAWKKFEDTIEKESKEQDPKD